MTESEILVPEPRPFTRRTFLKGAAASAAAIGLGIRTPDALAQNGYPTPDAVEEMVKQSPFEKYVAKKAAAEIWHPKAWPGDHYDTPPGLNGHEGFQGPDLAANYHTGLSFYPISQKDAGNMTLFDKVAEQADQWTPLDKTLPKPTVTPLTFEANEPEMVNKNLKGYIIRTAAEKVLPDQPPMIKQQVLLAGATPDVLALVLEGYFPINLPDDPEIAIKMAKTVVQTGPLA